MIDGRDGERNRSGMFAPFGRQPHQGQQIRAAGNREDEAGKQIETGEQPGRIEKSVKMAQQAAFFASRAAAVLSAAEALGYLRGNSEKKAQACSSRPAR